jgi:hypothetical protein
MMHSGCIVERDPKQIANKINELVRQYRDAIAFKNSTGQQHLSEEDMENAVFGICKYFNELDPILRDHPSTNPLLTNKQTLDVEDDENDRSTTFDGSRFRPSVAASSPESRNATENAQKKLSSSRKKKNATATDSTTKSSSKSSSNLNLSEERKSLVPKKQKKKEDSEGKTLLKLTKAMMTKYKCEEKKVKCEEQKLALERKKMAMEEQQRSLNMRFGLFSYRQQLKNLGVSEEDINKNFPMPSDEPAAIGGAVTEQLVTPGSTRLNLSEAIDLQDGSEGDSSEDSDSSSQS